MGFFSRKFVNIGLHMWQMRKQRCSFCVKFAETPIWLKRAYKQTKIHQIEKREKRFLVEAKFHLKKTGKQEWNEYKKKILKRLVT